MPHDKTRDAARQRMAQTGEPYTAARRAVTAGHQATCSPLRMSGEIRDWLAGRRDSGQPGARDVTQALAALMESGGRLGEPLVAATAGSWPAALADGLDQAYHQQLVQAAAARRGGADAAALAGDVEQQAAGLQATLRELRSRHRRLLDTGQVMEAGRAAAELAAAGRQAAVLQDLAAQVARSRQRLDQQGRRLQANADAFRVRKEVLKARSITARLGLDLDLGETAGAGHEGGAEERLLRDVTAEMERELGHEPWPGGLMELRPAGPDDDSVRILFAVEPPGAVLLLAVLDGPEAVRDQYLEAVLLAAARLRQVRDGQAPEAAAHACASTRSFLAEFYPAGNDRAR